MDKAEASFNTPEPAPKKSDQPATWDLVIADVLDRGRCEHADLVVTDMRERDAIGAAKYGVRHQAFNGRDHDVDAYQEALDLAMYLRASLAEKHDGTVYALYSEALTIVDWMRGVILRRRGR